MHQTIGGDPGVSWHPKIWPRGFP